MDSAILGQFDGCLCGILFCENLATRVGMVACGGFNWPAKVRVNDQSILDINHIITMESQTCKNQIHQLSQLIFLILGFRVTDPRSVAITLSPKP